MVVPDSTRIVRPRPRSLASNGSPGSRAGAVNASAWMRESGQPAALAAPYTASIIATGPHP